MKQFILVCFLFSTLLPGCNKVEQKKDRSESAKNESSKVFTTLEERQEYVAELLAVRAEKDSFLRKSSDSPFKKEQRRTFQGLKYFEVNPDFVVRATFHRNENPPPMTITTTTGSSRTAIKYGHLEFALSGKTHRLAVYKFTDKSDKAPKNYLFVPFTDSTSGEKRYGAGRYLDLEESETGEYVLDFNRAYNPYCAYNEGYSCPIPPRENRLSMAVTAGEKLYH